MSVYNNYSLDPASPYVVSDREGPARGGRGDVV